MKKLQFIVFILAIFVHVSFYISAYFTHTLDVFFEHVTSGQDFFTIPNAAYSFLHGGTLTGELPKGLSPFIDCCGVNSNVYHPLFTILIGVPLQLFAPWTAFAIWGFFHFIISIILIIFLWKKFSNHRYLYIALSIYLLNSHNYYEIQHAQYHFLLSFFTIFFLYESIIKGDTKMAGIWLFLGLLVKPIGLLWILPLLLYKRFKTVTIGLGCYLIASVPFIISPVGKYYFDHIFGIAGNIMPTYNLISLVHFFPIPLEIFKYLSVAMVFILLGYQIIRKPPIFNVIFFWITFQLAFYGQVYPYHYSILAGLIALGILLNSFILAKLEVLFLIILITIPTPIIFLRLNGAPSILTPKEFSFIALWSLSLLLLLCIAIVKRVSIQHE